MRISLEKLLKLRFRISFQISFNEFYLLVRNEQKKIERFRQKHNENFDGEAFWKSFKPLLKKINVPMQWNLKNHKKLVKSFESQADIINKDKDDDGNLIEHIHFIKQLLKIPYKDDGICSFTRFMQLALNFGQLKGSTYDESLNELIKTNLDHLGNYNNYINELPNISSDLSEIFKILDGHLNDPPLLKK